MAFVGLMVAFPLLLVSAILITLTSPGPILFKQVRVGLGGTQFLLFKLRTMTVQKSDLQITAGDDIRITPVGRWLRRFKIDELPQLWNVLIGDLSLVGPRPEVPRYVNTSHPLWQEVLAVRPGLTDPVTLRLRNEEELLARVSSDREQFYLNKLLPFKLKGYVQYLRRRTLTTDLSVGWATVVAVVSPGRSSSPSLEEIETAGGWAEEET